MQTYSHFVLTKGLAAILQQRLRSQSTSSAWPPLETSSLLWGSVGPDLPLIALTAVFLGYDRLIPSGHRPPPNPNKRSATRYLFDTLFFEAWWVKMVHNVFHAPIICAGLLVVGKWGWRRGADWGSKLFWFGAACLFHTAIDIPLHHDDGPLLLFPLDWQMRYFSPLSYWDPARYGRQFIVIEHLFIAGVAGWLIRDWWRGRAAALAA